MWLMKRLIRYRKKNMLLILVVFSISVLFFISSAIRENSAAQITDFLATYKVTAYYEQSESFASNQRGGYWLTHRTAIIPLQYEEYIEAFNLTRYLDVVAASVPDGKQCKLQLIGLTDLTLSNRPELLAADLHGYTYEDFHLSAKEPIALVSTKLASALALSVGDSFQIIDVREKISVFTVCGMYSSHLAEAVVPVSQAKNVHVVNPNVLLERGVRITVNYDTNLFVLKDINSLRDFKLAMAQEQELKAARFVIDDSALTDTLRPLQITTGYMDAAILILLVVSIFIALMVSFILLKSRTVDIAILYCIGMPKIKIFFSLFAELLLTTLVAMLAGASAGFLLAQGFISVNTNIWDSFNSLLLLLAAFSIGAAASIISSIAIKPMDILTKKEG